MIPPKLPITPATMHHRHSYSIAQYIRGRYRELRKCESQEALDSMWGDVLVHRLALQEHCEDLIVHNPKVAEQASADKILWKYVYYDAMLECRKWLRLQVPQSELSNSLSSISGSFRGSDGTASIAGSAEQSSLSAESTGAHELEEWCQEWWAMTLTTLLNEALGYFQTLLSRVQQHLKDRSALDYSLAYLKGSGYRFPPSYMIARRLYLNIGDIYRYQCMHLPQLSAYSGIGAINTASLIALAQATYSRARAMHVDSGGACIQLALLAAHTHSRFDAVFWRMCGLCYDDSNAPLCGRRMAEAAVSDADAVLWGDGHSEDDQIEDLVARLAQEIVQRQQSATNTSSIGCKPFSDSDNDNEVYINRSSLTDSRGDTNSSNTIHAPAFRNSADHPVEKLYHALLAALTEDLDEAQNCDAPLHLDADFWSREYQLSAILAALLTTVAYGNSRRGSNGDGLISKEPVQTALHTYMIQHLAAVLLLRQMMCLQQTLEINGLENEEDEDYVSCVAYPLMSLALWVDIWRSGPHLLSSLDGKIGTVDMGSGFSDSIKRLFSCLLLLIRSYSDLDLDPRSPNTYSDLANMALPSDVSLMGWMSLRPVQKKLRYSALGALPGTFAMSAKNLMDANCSNSSFGCDTISGIETKVSNSLLGVWQNARKMMRVVFARTQSLMALMISEDPDAVLTWSVEHGRFVVGEVKSKENDIYQLEQHRKTESFVFLESSNRGVGGCPSSKSSSFTSIYLAPDEEVAQAKEDPVAFGNNSWPIYVPDVEFWLDHLPLIQKMLLSKRCAVVLPAAVHDRLLELTRVSKLEYRASAALQLIDNQDPAQNLLVQNADESLTRWEDACDYYVIGLDEIDEYELPSIMEVAEDMRGIIMSTLYLAHTKCPDKSVVIVTDSDELEFYASWFGIERESSATILGLLA
ncbi:hypothetical protein EV177_007089 [Coemansia sp. RSA 1804]|nr:hypothetical protein EV177_007089 [Coemansia sp. RSA 1804]